MARVVSIVLGVAVGAVVAAACSSSSGTRIDAAPDAPSQSCLDAVGHSDLAWIQGEVFDMQCEFSGCHGSDSGGNTGRQSLQDGSTIASLVNQASNLEPSQTLVIPGNSAGSYLMVMLGSVAGTIPATDAAGDQIGTMPLDTNGELVCQEKRDAIARWIDAGATDDLPDIGDLVCTKSPFAKPKAPVVCLTARAWARYNTGSKRLGTRSHARREFDR